MSQSVCDWPQYPVQIVFKHTYSNMASSVPSGSHEHLQIEPFGMRLRKAVLEKKNPVCVGLDPRWESLPEYLQTCETPFQPSFTEMANAYRQFCFEVIDAVAPLVPIVKPQVAFFEQLGPFGMVALAEIISYANSKGLLVIADAKRNDIGTTAEAYAAAYLGRNRLSAWGSDSLTVSPYLGDDSLQPFVDRCENTGSGLFVLVKTSNAGSGFIQDLKTEVQESPTIMDRVADWVEGQSKLLLQRSTDRGQIESSDNGPQYGPIGAVVGATYPQQLTELRERMKSCWLLIPGYGAQGGGAKDVAGGFDSKGLGAVVNNSRGIIFAYNSPKYSHYVAWQDAVTAATNDMISALRAETSVGKLGN